MLYQEITNMSATSTIRGIRKTFKQKGGPAMKNVRRKLLQFKDDNYSAQALRYLSKVTLHNALPVFPALVSMAYEAVGGSDEKTTPFGEAILLISFAADLHDDVIDQSANKGSKQTVLGRFNESTAILAGDILFVEGLKQLTEAAKCLTKEKSKEILSGVSDAVYEICTAESLQLQLKNETDLTPKQYLEVIRLKSVVPELCMKIGALIGTNKIADVESIGQFGRMYGINSVIVEEFGDLLNLDEFTNRLKCEVPPLPMIYASQNSKLKTSLGSLLASEIDETVHEKMVDIILNSAEVEELHKILVSNALTGQKLLPKIVKGEIRKELENLLIAPLQFFES
jgi:geranylgeranyl pyrophosphate synthase